MSGARPKSSAKKPPAADASEFMRQLDHPLKRDIGKVRDALLAVAPSIQTEVKWNSLSFRTTEFFATVHLRSTDHVQVVFHCGAKARRAPFLFPADPAGLARRLAPDRCLVTLGSGRELAGRLPALQEFTRRWIAQL